MSLQLCVTLQVEGLSPGDGRMSSTKEKTPLHSNPRAVDLSATCLSPPACFVCQAQKQLCKCLIAISGVKASQALLYTDNLNGSPAVRDAIGFQEVEIVDSIWQ